MDWQNHPNITSCNISQVTLNPNKINTSSASYVSFCDACKYGKLSPFHFPSVTQKTTQPLQLVCSYVWGSSPCESNDGFKYYISFVDDYSSCVWIYPLHLISEVATIVPQFITMAERQLNSKVKCLQTDWGDDYRTLAPSLNSLDIE